MSISTSLTPAVVLRNYFHAKDENRPHLLDRVFTEDALLAIHNDSAAIAFPAETVGRTAIADVLVRSFGQTYENVYSFYLDRPSGVLDAFACEWIVAMTDKASRSVRLGCGEYEWRFSPRAPRLASSLTIRITAMRVLPPSETEPVLALTRRLSYPWSSRAEAEAVSADHAELASVLRTLPTRQRGA